MNTDTVLGSHSNKHLKIKVSSLT